MISQNQFVIVRMSCGIASFSCICHILVCCVYICVCTVIREFYVQSRVLLCALAVVSSSVL